MGEGGGEELSVLQKIPALFLDIRGDTMNESQHVLVPACNRTKVNLSDVLGLSDLNVPADLHLRIKITIHISKVFLWVAIYLSLPVAISVSSSKMTPSTSMLGPLNFGNLTSYLRHRSCRICFGL